MSESRNQPKKQALKVFGVQTFIGGGQRRTIVATTSRAAAVRALQAAGARSMTEGSFKTYGAVTRNPVEVQVATSRPGVVFVARDSFSRDFVPVEPREAGRG